MIQIKPTIQRNIDKICKEHYDSLQATILAKAANLKVRQREFIENNIEEILTSKPKALFDLHKDYVQFCKAPGRAKLKHYNTGLSGTFNYKWFTKKDATHYCGYDLAKKLNFKTCPYCNRNYTVTVAEGMNRTVRPDFDHFFPHKQYPLLALSFYNLIPSCLICNRTIKNQAKIVYGKYIHPYEEGFGTALKINYFPMDMDSSVGLKENYSINLIPNPIEPEKSKRCINSFGLFKLKEIYQESHGGEIADVIRRHNISNGKYLEILHKAFPKLGSIEELYNIAFGNYHNEEDFEKRPLSKMTKDIVEQLVFAMPTIIKKVP
jgi:hypothetical protein